MDNVLVSVITPVFNSEDSIRNCFESLQKQTNKDFEWIVIDDHSTDSTSSILQELEQNNDWIKYCKNEINQGAAVSRNKGIELANGRYIAFLDSDDAWDENKIERQLSYMNSKDAAFSCTSYRVLKNSNIKAIFRPKKEIIQYRDLLKSCSIGCLTVMYDTAKIGKVFMPLNAEKREDHATWIDITKTGVPCFRLDEILATYNVGCKSTSSNKRKMFKYQYLMYRRHLEFSRTKSLFYTLVVSFNKIFRKYR